MREVTTATGLRTTAAILVGGVGLIFATIPGPKPPPHVDVMMTATGIKLAGTRSVTSGWVTFRISAPDGEHHLWLVSPSVGPRGDVSTPAGDIRSLWSVNAANPRASTVTTPHRPSADPQMVAGYQRTAQESLIALGGAWVDAGHPATISAELPAGDVYLEDLGASAVSDAVLHVGWGKYPPMPARPVGEITEGDDNFVFAPPVLPGHGTLELANADDTETGYHFLVIRAMAAGATREDVERFFSSGTGPSPLASAALMSAPLSAGQSQFLSYALPSGEYAILDAWMDPVTGRVLAGDGALTTIRLR
ncbi:MAG TPA: hypothetical protein VHV82_15205 [Sporichthyaceae bacterium]|jgi:hypothetical protein|nr:hypothetical protein [Sporichthyaceae bacterium]